VFRILRHRFRCEAITPVFFPDGKAENVLRGMAGMLIPRVAGPELAAKLLRPEWPEGPSGYKTPPKPYRFCAFWLDKRRISGQESFTFEVFQYAPELPVREILTRAIGILENEGLGPGRGLVRLLDVETEESLHPLAPGREVGEVRLRLLTPVEIELGFPVFLARVAERIQALGACYQGLGWPGAPAGEGVELIRDETVWVDRERLSTRTGQRYQTGGRVGEIVYAGALTGAFPYLETGQWTGAGNGLYEVVG
jgi:hypothetical protein